jgi:hypothetical protein
MENPNPRIEFYRQRSFSEKMNVIFAFIRENWKPLLKYSFYLIMPVCLIQTLAMNSFFSFYINALTKSTGNNPFGNSMVSFLSNYGAFMFCVLIGSGIMSGLIYAMIQTYAVRENRLQDVTLNDFKDLLVKNTWKYIRLILALIVVFTMIAFVMGLLAAYVSAWSLIVMIPMMLACILFMIPLMLVVPTYIFERDITFFNAIKKAWKLGMATLWGMIGLMIVLYFISSVIQTITMLPWYVMILFGSIFSITSESVMTQSIIYKFFLYIFGLIQSYGMYVSMIIGIIGLAFQYFHAREKVEGVTIESNITNFDNL